MDELPRRPVEGGSREGAAAGAPIDVMDYDGLMDDVTSLGR